MSFQYNLKTLKLINLLIILIVFRIYTSKVNTIILNLVYTSDLFYLIINNDVIYYRVCGFLV